MLELADRTSKQLLERVYKGKEKHNENTDGESGEKCNSKKGPSGNFRNEKRND